MPNTYSTNIGYNLVKSLPEPKQWFLKYFPEEPNYRDIYFHFEKIASREICKIIAKFSIKKAIGDDDITVGTI